MALFTAVLHLSLSLIHIFQQSEGKPICLRLERNGRQKEVKITPVLSNTAQTYQIGAWIRDSIQGIGTVTYYDAENGTFAALP